MRRSSRKKPALLAVLALLLSLVGVALPSTPASAAAVMPTLQWPAVNSVVYDYHQMTTSPKGAVTVGCYFTSGTPRQDLITRGPTGSISRQLDRTASVDGTIKNCIVNPVVDKKGDLYGKPDGSAKLFAYSGNTLKWKYDTGCNRSSDEPVVGADGNIYFLNGERKLIGVKPSLDAGQTAPTKVLEVDVDLSCGQGNLMYAYRDGIAVERNYGTDLRYVSYGGEVVADLPAEVDYIQTQTPINSEGRVFFTKTLVGNPSAAQVSAYDLRARKVVWSTIVSTPGAPNSGVFGLYPTPLGGVVVKVREQKMANGFPTTPAENVHKLVTLNPFGATVEDTVLPNVDSNGNAYSEPYIFADTTGKVVIVRNLTIKRSSSPYQVPGVDIFVIDPTTGSSFYTGKIRGNLTTSDGEIYGYTIRVDTRSIRLGPNTLYLNTVKCSSNCATSTSYTLRAVKVDGLGMDYPRGAVLATTPRPATPYLALGDSFSSGEGVEPFEDATELPDVNTCHRSENAYARLISGTSANIPALGTGGFRACSGAVSNNVWSYAQWNEGTQLDLTPDSSTRLVTLTIGGNDIGFANYAEACISLSGSCAIDSEAYNTAIGKINNVLPGNLEATYKKILQATPNAQIYVMGYPHVMAQKAPDDPWDLACIYMADGGITWSEANAVRDLTNKLNAKIRQKVDDVRAVSAANQRLHFVEVNGDGSPFKGHEICSPEGVSYFHNVNQVIHGQAFVFHPNALGQQAYAELAKAAINAG